MIGSRMPEGAAVISSTKEGIVDDQTLFGVEFPQLSWISTILCGLTQKQ